MRVTTLFNRLLAIPGASVADVRFAEDGVEVVLRPHARVLQCPCGMLSDAAYDRRERRWRHLDLGTHRLWLVCEIRRLECPDCGVRTEELPWARPGARHTRDFEDTVVWLAQRTDRTTISALLRCGWDTVTAIINRTVAEMIDHRRLGNIYRIGVDEICYRHPSKYLTVVGDHDTGTVIDVRPGRGSDSLALFYAARTERERARIALASMDAAPAYRGATEKWLPAATICLDPFHVIRWANKALDAVFSTATAARHRGRFSSGQWRAVRGALRTGRDKLTRDRRRTVNQITKADRQIGKAWRLKENLRDFYRQPRTPLRSRKYLRRWITDAKHSNIPAFVGLARQIDNHFQGILAAKHLGISNALLEGINSKIRLINARGYGHHSAQTLTSMIYLCLGGIAPKLPTQS